MRSEARGSDRHVPCATVYRQRYSVWWVSVPPWIPFGPAFLGTDGSHPFPIIMRADYQQPRVIVPVTRRFSRAPLFIVTALATSLVRSIPVDSKAATCIVANARDQHPKPSANRADGYKGDVISPP